MNPSEPECDAPLQKGVYVLVLAVSIAIAATLWWFTARYNIPLGGGS